MPASLCDYTTKTFLCAQTPNLTQWAEHIQHHCHFADTDEIFPRVPDTVTGGNIH
jgi:hypothetical protein